MSSLLQQTSLCAASVADGRVLGGEAGATGPGCLPPSLGGERHSGVTVQAHSAQPLVWGSCS